MEGLSPESRALHELFMTDAHEENEALLVSYRKEAASVIKVFVNDTTAQICNVRSTIDVVSSAVHADLDAIQVTLGHDLAGVRSSLSNEILALSSTLDRLLRSGSAPNPAAPVRWILATALSAKLGTTCHNNTGG
jgi:hypothetical protein